MILLKTISDIKKMRLSGQILKQVHLAVSNAFQVGIAAQELDEIAFNKIKELGAIPSFLGYKGYKFTTCISKNEEVVHGLPLQDKIFLPGDICCVDIGVYYEGFHTDAARILHLDPISSEIQALIKVTTDSFYEGIKHAKPGNRLGEISHSIQSHVEQNGFSVVRDLFSHGIGKSLHEDPLIPNFGPRSNGPLLKEGMTFAIEPMVNIGTSHVLTLPDKWTIITRDKKFSAHYENTIYISNDGPEILT